MDRITETELGKAYKRYPPPCGRLLEWDNARSVPRHTPTRVPNREIPLNSAVYCRFSFPVSVNVGYYFISPCVSETWFDGPDLPIDRRYEAILLNVASAETFIELFNFSASLHPRIT